MVGNISFFENIFYWLWYYIKKIRIKGASPAETTASTIALVLKFFNFIFIFTVISIIIDYNIFLDIVPHAQESEGLIRMAIIPIALLIMYMDERRYLKKFHLFKERHEMQNEKQRNRSKAIFLIYLLVTIGTCVILPSLVTDYLLR